MALKELPVPPTCQMSERAAEVLRVWINDKNNMDVTLLPAFERPEAWGILLVDIARHAARSFAGDGAMPADAAIELIKAGFDAEWDNPTDIGSTTKVRSQ